VYASVMANRQLLTINEISARPLTHQGLHFQEHVHFIA
jgi:hypothetical protein